MNNNDSDGAALRSRLERTLEDEGFEVVLGEDDGLERLRKRYNGLADDNELSFVRQYAGAIVLVAESVGSFCELGLFSHACLPLRSGLGYDGDLILIANKKHEEDQSYFNNGPAKAVDALGGKLIYTDFASFDISQVIERLMHRRSVWVSRKLTE